MPKLGIDVSNVISDRCAKTGCNKRAVHRHHRKHEFMWCKILNKINSPLHEEIEVRYLEFRKEDITPLCEDHHKEIHFLYNVLIQCHIGRCGVSLKSYTPKQMYDMMDMLDSFCQLWLTIITPGANANVYLNKENLRTSQRTQKREDSIYW